MTSQLTSLIRTAAQRSSYETTRCFELELSHRQAWFGVQRPVTSRVDDDLVVRLLRAGILVMLGRDGEIV